MRWLVLWMALFLPLLAVANDEVEDMRATVDRPSAPEPKDPPKRWHWEDPPEKKQHCDNDCDHDSDDTLTGEMLGAAALAGGIAVTTPVWGPRSLVDGGKARSGWFTGYPYQFHNSYMTFGPPREGDPEPWDPNPWSLRVESDFGTNFSNQQLLGGHVLWEHYNQLGIETRFERLEDEVAGLTNSLWFGDLNGTYRFAQSEHWLFRGGLGLNWLTDQGDDHYGFNATYQIDWFPTEPFVFSTDIDLGRLGDASLFHFQQTAGVTWHGIEARIGYGYLDVGDAQFSMFLCGVRAWF